MVGDSVIFGWWRPTRGEPWGRARRSVDSQPARLVYRAGVTCLSFSFYQIAKQQFRPPSVTKTGKNLTDALGRISISMTMFNTRGETPWVFPRPLIRTLAMTYSGKYFLSLDLYNCPKSRIFTAQCACARARVRVPWHLIK